MKKNQGKGTESPCSKASNGAGRTYCIAIDREVHGQWTGKGGFARKVRWRFLPRAAAIRYKNASAKGGESRVGRTPK